MPEILFYGDDFTGATDTLATATRAGLRTLLFLQLPTPARLAAAGALDCIGIAGASRSMTPAEMRRELEPVAALFARSGARVLHYKTCSTFDSAPEVGSIGTAIEVLGAAVSVPWTAIVGGQPDLERYCLFGNLFAAAGSGGEVHRIDRHPTMSRHPVTPMHEADLRRHFALQGVQDVGSVAWPVYARGDAAVTDALASALATPAGAAAPVEAVLFDVGDNAHLAAIGRALRARMATGPEGATQLVVGPSSVVQAFAPPRPSAVDAVAVAPADGPVMVWAGSLSPVTARQVAAARSFEVVRFDARRLATDAGYREEVAVALSGRLAAGIHVLGCTVGEAEAGTAGAAVPPRELARAGSEVLARVLDATPLSRIGVAGGDTSSHAVQALDAWGLSYLAALSPGAALCRLHSDRPSLDGMEIMLKGGQMGAVDVFERLVRGTLRA